MLKLGPWPPSELQDNKHCLKRVTENHREVTICEGRQPETENTEQTVNQNKKTKKLKSGCLYDDNMTSFLAFHHYGNYFTQRHIFLYSIAMATC